MCRKVAVVGRQVMKQAAAVPNTAAGANTAFVKRVLTFV
jgi:hypothetical protein